MGMIFLLTYLGNTAIPKDTPEPRLYPGWLFRASLQDLADDSLNYQCFDCKTN